MSTNNENPYSEFNNYPQAPQPAQPIYIEPDMSAEQNRKKSNTLGIWSIVLAPLTCCCCGIPIPAIIGLILGIVGLSKNKGNVCCIVGIVLNGLILAYTIYTLAITDWSAASQMFSELGDMYEQALTDPEGFMENYQSYMDSYSQYAQN